MHKSKACIGIGIMVIGTIFLLIEIGRGLEDEMNYQWCTHPPWTAAPDAKPYIPCHNFLYHIRFILVDVAVLSVGIWLLIFGIKEISLISFSKES